MVIGDRLSNMVIRITIKTLLLSAIILSASLALAALYAVASQEPVMPGAGYIMVLLGGCAAVTGGVGMSQIPSRIIMTTSVIFYHTVFTPVRDAMISTPTSYYDRSVVLVVSGMLSFLVGLVLIG